MLQIISVAPGPVIRARRFLTSTDWSRAPLRLTPMTWPVVLNRYETSRVQNRISVFCGIAVFRLWFNVLPVATAMSARSTDAMSA